MKWVKRPHKDRELIHCADRYGGKIKVHVGGFINLATLTIDPHGDLAMNGNLHAVTAAGLFELAREVPAAADSRLEQRELHGRSVMCLMTTGQLELGPYVAARQELCVDAASYLPAQLRLWNRSGELMEHYTYRDIRTDLQLSERDFDVLNPRYDF